MKPIKDAWCMQIELNNYCPHSCAYCTRFTHHLPAGKRYNMAPSQLAAILTAMRRKGYAGKLGVIGGEPTIHPQFAEVCEVIREEWTGHGLWLALWTSGGRMYEQHRADINRTFSWVAVNDKSDQRCHHQPMTMASQDVVPDAAFRASLIDDCWVQRIWCPSITPRGVFFCECAAAWDLLLDGPGGWPLDSDWLSYGPEDYKAQMWACQMCGMPVPMPSAKLGEPEHMSVSVYDSMMAHGCANMGLDKVIITQDHVDAVEFAKRIDDWEPGEYTPGRAKGGAI